MSVMIWNESPAVGEKLLTRPTLSVPARVTLPVTWSWSYWPAPVPPSLMSRVPLLVWS